MNPILADLIQAMKDYAAVGSTDERSKDEFVDDRAKWLIEQTSGDRDCVLELAATVKADELFLEKAGAGEFHYALRLGMIFGHAIKLIEEGQAHFDLQTLKSNPAFGRF